MGIGSMGRVSFVLIAVCAVCVMPTALEAGSVGKYKCGDRAKVYLGNAGLFQRPCTISADRVYRSTAEYREILDKGLTDKDVRYHFLMKAAGRRFAKAVKKMARTHKHDLVAETGCVSKAKKDAPDIPDRTADVISEL